MNNVNNNSNDCKINYDEYEKRSKETQRLLNNVQRDSEKIFKDFWKAWEETEARYTPSPTERSVNNSSTTSPDFLSGELDKLKI